MDNKPIPVTRDGYERLQQELARDIRKFHSTTV